MSDPRDRAPGLGRWSSRDVARSDVTDAWQSALADNYGAWQVHRAVGAGFEANLRNRDFSGLRVVECVCDPCTGRRVPQLIGRGDAAYIGVQITKAGSEQFHFGGETVSVGPGDLLIWTSTQPTEFTVLERLHKVSLILPWADIRERLPRGTPFTGTMMDSRCGIGAVLFRHVDSLAQQIEGLGEHDQAAVRRATLELLTAAMGHRVDAPPRGLATRYLQQLQDHILANLQDEGMTPTTIAAANHMSPRYVHMLFAQAGVTVSAWIKAQRLERCREDLRNRRYRDAGIAEIAYGWGFNDPTHFSRVFKLRYGVSPSAYREGAADPGARDAGGPPQRT